MPQALRIFLSSTDMDMKEYREKVAEAVLKLDYLPVTMKDFNAKPKKPVDVCKDEVLECDALVVMVAHRYGWVPTVEEGGDGKKSITRIEVETALENNIPVYAFIVDGNFGWVQKKEQDMIVEKDDLSADDTAKIIQNVKSLKEFKTFLETKANVTRELFTTPDNLALKVNSSLTDLKEVEQSPKKMAFKKLPFSFRIVHPLQPAPHFRGRQELLADLKQWWHEPITPDRVRSLVAIGGTGKTAVVEQFLKSIYNEKLRGNVLVWSFYEDPNTDSFLREACFVFTGEEPEGEGGKLEKLQRALSADNNQHLLVLDGLERIQSEGKGSIGRAYGDLEDHRLKNLIRYIAAGLSNVRALITSRFRLTDLAHWENAGYKSYELDVLDKETAIEVLRAWEIKGDDKGLLQLVASVGYHALSVSVLGSYLKTYCNGNPKGAKEFKLDDFAPDESQAARLGRILGSYAKNLSGVERDLLIRLSIFPNGVSIDILLYVIDAGGEIAGALVGVNQSKLIIIAEKLIKQGLIYCYKKENAFVYTAHPFLREYFRGLLGVKPENIHEVVMSNLAVGLDVKPQKKPTDTEMLDKYEKLIEHSILAGHFTEAYDLYHNVMGGDPGESHLYYTIGDYGRIIRIISFFSADGTPLTFTDQLSQGATAYFFNKWALAARELGDLVTADLCIQLGSRLHEVKSSIAMNLQNRAWIAVDKGLFPSAKKFSDESLVLLEAEDKDDNYVKYVERQYFANLAYILHSMGEISLAKENFSKATQVYGEPLYAATGLFEARCLFDLGKKQDALKRAKENLKDCELNYWPKFISLCYYMLGVICLPDSISESREYLKKLRQWAEKSGVIECIIKSNILASEIAYCSGDYPVSSTEAIIGLNQADSSGFGQFAIDLLLQLSKINIATPDYKAALSYARQALDRSTHPDCCYAWGEANGLHLTGVCHKALGEYDLARMRLEAAIKIREKIQHPEVEETRKLLAELPVK